ncbi:hypothetical protein HY734_01765 [Candidatus Uhrbacteria bacterium]|nr:hypothetical protein [Candidatus Uhrbacteria bacterium]
MVEGMNPMEIGVSPTNPENTRLRKRILDLQEELDDALEHADSTGRPGDAIVTDLRGNLESIAAVLPKSSARLLRQAVERRSTSDVYAAFEAALKALR